MFTYSSTNPRYLGDGGVYRLRGGAEVGGVGDRTASVSRSIVG